MARPRRSMEERFDEFRPIGEPDACWLWLGPRRRGYGSISLGGTKSPQVAAHRHAWELANGPIPTGLVIRHRCDVMLCCNPAHMELGTIADNNADMVARGRQARGSGNGNARLTEESVAEVRRQLRRGDRQQDIADHFGVSQALVSLINRGAIWRPATTQKEMHR